MKWNMTRKTQCNAARRKMRAALARIDDMHHLFGDIDGVLENGAMALEQRVSDLFDEFDKEMRDTVEEYGP